MVYKLKKGEETPYGGYLFTPAEYEKVMKDRELLYEISKRLNKVILD